MATAAESARALLNAGQFLAAQRFCEAALAGGEDAELHYLLASALHRQSRTAPALTALERALALAPDRDDIRFARASVLAELGRVDDAAVEMQRCLDAAPKSPELMVALADLRERRDRLDEARALYDRALAIDPDNFAAGLNLGALLLRQRRLEEALARFDAVAARYGSPDAQVNRCQALLALVRDEEALAAANAAVALDPRHLLALVNRAQALAVLGLTAESEEAFRLARQTDPQGFQRIVADASYGAWTESPPDPLSIAMLRSVQVQQQCDWTRRDRAVALARSLPGHVLGSLLSRRHALVAFDLLALPLSPEEQHAIAVHVAGGFTAAALPLPGPRADTRIRVGFLSPDFRQHPMAWLGRPILQGMDRARFEVIAYALNFDDGDPLRRALLRDADRAVDLSALDEDAAARRIAADGIDVLVECGGYCEATRPGIVARRPAAVIASYLGMPGTLGMASVDYRVSDAFCTPPGQQRHWTEKLALLPETHLAYAPPEPAMAPEREALGLPEHGFVFACLNNPMKIDPTVFGAWMRMLKTVEGSVLWLFSGDDRTKAHLRAAAATAGADPERLRFTGRLPRETFVAAAARADLFVDTLSFGAHTTALDVLWGGLPLLACAGETMASRLAGSLLHAARIPELVTHDLASYERTAIELAHDTARLSALRERVIAARGSSPIFDTPERVKAFERAVETMHRRRIDGRRPEPLVVA